MTNTLGIIIENNRPVVSSRKVAEIFEKEHRRVLQDIRELSCGDDFRLHNFVQSSYINSQDKEQPEYLMTRDGFTLRNSLPFHICSWVFPEGYTAE